MYNKSASYRKWSRELSKYLNASVYPEITVEIVESGGDVPCVVIPRFRFEKTVRFLKTSIGHFFHSPKLTFAGIDNFAVSVRGETRFAVRWSL